MSIRTEKVASLLQHEIGSILEKELPRGGALVTVVAVKVTADLSIARFYVSIIGTEKQQAEVMAWLLGDGAARLTGQVIAVDGGFTTVRPLVK